MRIALGLVRQVDADGTFGDYWTQVGDEECGGACHATLARFFALPTARGAPIWLYAEALAEGAPVPSGAVEGRRDLACARLGENGELVALLNDLVAALDEIGVAPDDGRFAWWVEVAR